MPIVNRQSSIVIRIFLVLISCLFFVSACESQRDRTEKSRIHYRRGLRYAKDVNMQEAILELQYAIKLDPSFEAPYYRLAVIYQEIGGLENAIVYYRDFLKFNPDHLDTHIRLATIYKINGRDEAAINEAEYIINRVPVDSKIAIDMHNILGGIYLYRKREYEPAIYHYKKVLAKRPDMLDPYISFAKYYLQNRETDKAMGMIQKALALSPQNLVVYDMLLDFYYEKKDWDNIITIYRKIIEYYPKKTKKQIMLAELLMKLKRYPEAKAEAYKIFKRDPNDARMRYILGEVAYQQGEYKLALDHFLYLENINYSINTVFPRLGKLFIKIGKFDKAKKTYEKLAFTRPDVFEAQYYMTLLSLKSREYLAARRSASALKKNFLGFREADFFIGKTQFFTNNVQGAIISMEKYHKYDEEAVTKTNKYDFYKLVYPSIIFPEEFHNKNRNRNQVESRYILGTAYLIEDKYEKAVVELEKLIFDEPNLPFGFILAAIAYHRLGDYDNALKHCRMTEVLVRIDKPLVNFVTANIYASKLDLEKAHLFLQRSEGAIHTYDFSNVDVTKYVGTTEPASLADLSLAIFMLRNRWKERAIKLSKRVLQHNPDNPVAKFIIDNMYMLFKKHYKTLTEIEDQLDRITIPVNYK